MLQRDSEYRVVALRTLPRAVTVKSRLDHGELAVVEVEDALDAATFELQGEGKQRALRPRTTGRWEKILVNESGSRVAVVDRWGNDLRYEPLDTFDVRYSSWTSTAMLRPGGGIVLKYDGNGRIQEADLGPAGKVSYGYDASGQLASVTNPRGQRKEYRYSSRGVPAALVSMNMFPIRAVFTVVAILVVLIAASKLRSRAQPRDRL
jgi:hypothetical protein